MEGSPFFYCLFFVTTTVGAVRGDRQESHEAQTRTAKSAMAPKTRAKSKPPATEAAAAAASPSAPRAKRGRAAAAAETLPQASEGEANNLAQGGVTQGAYEALQQEMAIMR